MVTENLSRAFASTRNDWTEGDMVASFDKGVARAVGGPKVEPPAGATAADRHAAFMGRQA
ncbi:MAG: hypothetical protein QOC92_3558 [Acidimicrobiaceae bacterium]|jgi:hypothetical protein